MNSAFCFTSVYFISSRINISFAKVWFASDAQFMAMFKNAPSTAVLVSETATPASDKEF